MIHLLQTATGELADFLGKNLPKLSDDWWQKHVVDRLSFQQQRMVQERGHCSLQQLDFAALLRVFDQNWYDLSNSLNLPREGRSWVKELQTVRNKWAHLTTESLPPCEVYRDADTLGRLLQLVGAQHATLNAIEARKAAAVAAMAKNKSDIGDGTAGKDDTAKTPAHPPPPATPKTLFQVGDLVALRSDPTTILPIIEIIPAGGGETRYRVFQNHSRSNYYESQLQAPAGSSDDLPRISAAELLARVTAIQLLSPSTASLFSLRSGRVQFVPYQYRPVLRLIRADRPRLLIADEVGVGKTIEAGLIIKELRARTDLSSVLIICPKALVSERKWFLEMKRFDEQFTALDGRLLRHCLREASLDGEWPEQYAKVILPFSLFDSDLVYGQTGKGTRKKDGLLDMDPPPRFGLVIVDEAHHIRNSDTYLHQGVRFFCDHAEAVIFLSATPVQLGSNDLYTLLNVLRPDLIIDPASFAQMAEPNRHINTAVGLCRAAHEGWQHGALNYLDQAARTDWGRMFLREAPAFQSIYDQLQGDPLIDAERVAIIRAIEEIYTFSGLISRTRRRDIGEFTTRKPETVTVDFTPAQKDLHDGLLSIVARILEFCHGQQNVKFMMTTIRRQAASCLYGLVPLLEDILTGKLEQLEFKEVNDSDEDADLSFVDEVREDIAALLEKARNLDRKDPKIEAFARVVTEKGRLVNNKVLVFSTFRHTLAYLAEHLENCELRFGLVHGSVPDEERSDLRRRFALPKEQEEAIDVLLSSEVGCEGLDFQFCDFLINYDLPWNPMRIEQRIGRIDRYGQKSQTIAIINFVIPGTVDADIYERCLLRIGVFQHAIGGNEEILGAITKEIHAIAESFTLTAAEREARLRQLSDNEIRIIHEEQTLESNQAELFGLNIPNQAWREEVEAAENQWLSPSAVQRCVSFYLTSRLGTNAERILGEKEAKTLRLSQDARATLLEDFKRLGRSTDAAAREWEKWLKGGQSILSITFDQRTASEDRSIAHLWVMHPLVRQAAHYLQLTEPAYASLFAQSSDIPAGKYRFALYRWKKQGVKADESLISVSSDPGIEDHLLPILLTANETIIDLLPSRSEFDELDARHHQKWTSAHANHIADNRQHVEHRIQSLKASHLARCRAIEDNIARASNTKIALMKQSELARATADFCRRMAELQRQATSGDIHATAVLFGDIVIKHQGPL